MWQLLGLPGDQIELVALRVGERGVADRRHARWQRRRRELDLVEWPGAQGGEPLGLVVVVVGDQDGMHAVFGGPGPGGMVPDHPGAAVGPVASTAVSPATAPGLTGRPRAFPQKSARAAGSAESMVRAAKLRLAVVVIAPPGASRCRPSLPVCVRWSCRVVRP